MPQKETEVMFNHSRLERACEIFCQQHGFEHYLLYGTIFTHLLSPLTYTVHSPGTAARIKKQSLHKIINDSITSSTPVVVGNIDKTSPLHRSVTNIHRHAASKLLSITFPVHFPQGKFAFLHIAGNIPKDEINDRVINTLAAGNHFAQTVGTSITHLLESKLGERPPYLSARERECLLLSSDGATPLGISKQLGLSTHTIIYYLKTARQKLHSKNIQGAVCKALLSGDVGMQIVSEKD